MKVKLRIRVVPFEDKSFTAFRYVEMPDVSAGMTLLNIRNRPESDSNECVVECLDWDINEPDVIVANLITDDNRDTLGSKPDWLRREYSRSALLSKDYREWQIEGGEEC